MDALEVFDGCLGDIRCLSCRDLMGVVEIFIQCPLVISCVGYILIGVLEKFHR